MLVAPSEHCKCLRDGRQAADKPIDSRLYWCARIFVSRFQKYVFQKKLRPYLVVILIFALKYRAGRRDGWGVVVLAAAMFWMGLFFATPDRVVVGASKLSLLLPFFGGVFELRVPSSIPTSPAQAHVINTAHKHGAR